MKICSLYSGSRGNAVFLELGGTKLLVDAGKSARTLCNSLQSIGENIDEIASILLTHEHMDHISALANLLPKHPKSVHGVYASVERMREVRATAEVAVDFIGHPPKDTFTVGNVTVHSFPTPHDSFGSVGYRFEFMENGEKHAVAYATDIGYITDDIAKAITGAEAVVLESNHDMEMLRNGPYPPDLKRRILSHRGHLSNDDCADFACRLAESGTKYILLAHLSETNNEPSLAYDAVKSVLPEGIRLEVADPIMPVLVVGEREGVLC